MKKKYTLLLLLQKQPKKIKKYETFTSLVLIYNQSDELKKIKLQYKSYIELNYARIEPDNLIHFYRKNKINKNIFFPMFLTLKKKYVD